VSKHRGNVNDSTIDRKEPDALKADEKSVVVDIGDQTDMFIPPEMPVFVDQSAVEDILGVSRQVVHFSLTCVTNTQDTYCTSYVLEYMRHRYPKYLMYQFCS
jgi:hypothetical protein